MKLLPRHSSTEIDSDPKPVASGSGFTLVELLVAMAATLLLAVLVLGVVQAASNLLRQNVGRAQTFQEAQAAFESITRTLSAATLNTYLDYFNTSRNPRPDPSIDKPGALAFRPAIYGRNSDLHFVTGNELVSGQYGGSVFFTAPLDYEAATNASGTDGQLNGVGYFVRFGEDPSLPGFLDDSNNPARYRLYQFLQPAERLKVMITDHFSAEPPGTLWFTSDTDASNPRSCYPLAENIVAFTVLPMLSDHENSNATSLTDDFAYNTRVPWTEGAQPASMHQLPPILRVAMVVLDEMAMSRIQNGSSPPDLGFDPAGIFRNAENLEEDLQMIGDALAQRRLNYRIFQTDIPMRGARWSAQ